MSAITFFLSAWSLVLWFDSRNNMFLGHFHVLIQFILIIRIYQLVLKAKSFKKWLSVLMIVGSITLTILSLAIEPFSEFNPLGRMVSAIVLVSVAIAYFFKVLRHEGKGHEQLSAMLWFNSAVLIYFFTTQSIFVYANYVVDNKPLAIPVWVLHSILFWIFFILCAISVRVSLR